MIINGNQQQSIATTTMVDQSIRVDCGRTQMISAHENQRLAIHVRARFAKAIGSRTPGSVYPKVLGFYVRNLGTQGNPQITL